MLIVILLTFVVTLIARKRKTVRRLGDAPVADQPKTVVVADEDALG